MKNGGKNKSIALIILLSVSQKCSMCWTFLTYVTPLPPTPKLKVTVIVMAQEYQVEKAHLPSRLLNGDAEVNWRIGQMFMRTNWCAPHMTTNNPFFNVRPIFSALNECSAHTCPWNWPRTGPNCSQCLAHTGLAEQAEVPPACNFVHDNLFTSLSLLHEMTKRDIIVSIGLIEEFEWILCCFPPVTIETEYKTLFH